MGIQMIATNRQARLNYDITDTLEAGLVLRGSEVKALRESKVQINDAYIRFEDGQLYLVAMHIAAYSRAGTQGLVDRTRKRKLLLHRYELDRLNSRVNTERVVLVPMALYFKDSRVKLEMGVGKGRKTVDKRQIIAKRDADREARRELSDRSR